MRFCFSCSSYYCSSFAKEDMISVCRNNRVGWKGTFLVFCTQKLQQIRTSNILFSDIEVQFYLNYTTFRVRNGKQADRWEEFECDDQQQKLQLDGWHMNGNVASVISRQIHWCLGLWVWTILLNSDSWTNCEQQNSTNVKLLLHKVSRRLLELKQSHHTKYSQWQNQTFG